MKINATIPIELSEQQVREIVRRFLKDKYNLNSTEWLDRRVADGKVITTKFDLRGQTVGAFEEPASAIEKAAALIIQSLS